MCERPGYWRWFYQLLLEKIRSPVFEIIVGVVVGLFFFVSSLLIYDFDMTFTMRLALAALIIPSFLVFMHGIYRADDC